MGKIGGGGAHFSQGLWDFQFGVDLHIVSKSPLVQIILVNLVNLSRDGQHESCWPWHGLGWHGLGWLSLVWELRNTEG